MNWNLLFWWLGIYCLLITLYTIFSAIKLKQVAKALAKANIPSHLDMKMVVIRTLENWGIILGLYLVLTLCVGLFIGLYVGLVKLIF